MLPVMSSSIFCPDSFKSASVHSKLPASLFMFILDSSRSLPLDATLFTPAEYELFLREYVQYLCANINMFCLFQKEKQQKKQEHYLCHGVCPFFKCVLRKVQRECNTEGSFGNVNVFSFSRQASLPAGPENSTAVSFSLVN